MSSDAPELAFASWLDQLQSVRINYSLGLFHEIDFQVNEGYRRIPHGGVEIGGVLYGRIQPGLLTIEAFRPIDCEHASGPSFQLSERDLTKLRDSILAVPSDEELRDLVPVGWFISHTRSGLIMTERELQLFERYFPEPMRLTVLVKPEKFKATRFAFLLRDTQKDVDSDGESKAIILPLPGRAGKPEPIPMPSIPAPNPQAKTPTEFLPKAEPIIASVPPPLAADVISAPRRTQPAPRVMVKRNHTGRLLLVLLLAALLGCGAGYWAYIQLPPPIIALRVQKRANDILVLWDPLQTQDSRYAVIRINDSTPALLTDDQKTSGIAAVPLLGDTVKVEIVAQHWARDSRGIVRFVSAHALPSTVPSSAAQEDVR